MSVRRRLAATLFGGAALGTTGYIAAVTVAGLAVEEIVIHHRTEVAVAAAV